MDSSWQEDARRAVRMGLLLAERSINALLPEAAGGLPSAVAPPADPRVPHSSSPAGLLPRPRRGPARAPPPLDPGNPGNSPPSAGCGAENRYPTRVRRQRARISGVRQEARAGTRDGRPSARARALPRPLPVHADLRRSRPARPRLVSGAIGAARIPAIAAPLIKRQALLVVLLHFVLELAPVHLRYRPAVPILMRVMATLARAAPVAHGTPWPHLPTQGWHQRWRLARPMVDQLPVPLTLQDSQPHSPYFGQPPGRLLSPKSEPRGGAVVFTRWIRARLPTCTDQAKLTQNPCLLPVARRLRHSRTCWPHPGRAPARSGQRQARSHQAGLSPLVLSKSRSPSNLRLRRYRPHLMTGTVTSQRPTRPDTEPHPSDGSGPAAFQGLRLVQFTVGDSEEGWTCVRCRGDIVGCLHVVHSDCLERWVKAPHSRGRCPECNAPVL